MSAPAVSDPVKSDEKQPLVSVLTPCYNNADFLGECIESVLAQTYQNWTYLIVNNGSDDGSLEIVQEYAARDPRIKVHDNEEFLGMEANHNATLRRAHPEAKYCKMVFADDFIFPRCLEEMVAVAEQYPSVGVVGCYGLSDRWIAWDGLPYPGTFQTGRDVCRMFFLKGIYLFGMPTSVLYRADLVRNRDPFFDEANTHADTDTCIDLMEENDFGFVHQVLLYRRKRPDSQYEKDAKNNTLIAARLLELKRYGPLHLTDRELRSRVGAILAEYYNFLAVSLIRGNFDAKFWRYHHDRLEESGCGFSRPRIAGAILLRICRAVFNPMETMEKLVERIRS